MLWYGRGKCLAGSMEVIKAIALEVRALVHDEASGEMVYNDDPGS